MKGVTAGGKDVLIKAVAQAIPVYIMSVFKLLASTQESLERSIGKFWWNELTGAGGRHTHWISWDKFTKSKSEGGLGFREFKSLIKLC
jgi:hypothetical protein